MKTGTRSVDASLRIQLEGHLETVERQVEEWSAAAVALKLAAWEHDPRWLSLLQSAPAAAESVRVVSAKLGRLHELAAAEALVAERASERLAALGRRPATTTGPLELLRELKRCRPLHIVHGQLGGQRMDLGGRLFISAFGGSSVWFVVTVARITLDPNHYTPSPSNGWRSRSARSRCRWPGRSGLISARDAGWC